MTKLFKIIIALILLVTGGLYYYQFSYIPNHNAPWHQKSDQEIWGDFQGEHGRPPEGWRPPSEKESCLQLADVHYLVQWEKTCESEGKVINDCQVRPDQLEKLQSDRDGEKADCSNRNQ